MSFKVGDSVRILRCDACSKVIGKVVTIMKAEQDTFEVKFGRGRPQTGRPSVFQASDLGAVVDD